MKANNPFSGDQSSYREKMTALLRRHKRVAGEDSAVNLPGSLDLGDRLAEKIEEEQKKMEAKVGNMTCVLRRWASSTPTTRLTLSQRRGPWKSLTSPTSGSRTGSSTEWRTATRWSRPSHLTSLTS